MARKKSSKRVFSRKTASKRPAKAKLSAKKADEMRRRVIAHAVVDPAFRRKLFRNPKAVLGKGYKASDLKALEKIKASLPLLDVQLSHLAGTILCVDTGGGGTGVA